MQTIVIRVEQGGSNSDGIRRAAGILRNGGLVAFPTETVYGLGADGTSAQAVLRIYAVKGRPSDNPLILHIWQFEQLDAIAARVPDVGRRLVDKFWPGPLTVILPRSEFVPNAVTAGLDTVAVRMPGHDIALEFLAACEVPVAAPSANLSGRPSPTCPEDVMEDLDGKVDCIIDGGDCPVGIESTVIDVTGVRPVLLRPGAVTVEDLESVIGRIEVDSSAKPGALFTSDGTPGRPGARYQHYSLRAPVILFEGDPEYRVSALSSRIAVLLSEGKTVGVAALTESLPCLKGFAGDRLITRAMGSESDPSSVAAQVFSVLRALDRDRVDVIVVEGIDDSGVGFAVMNRLRKAAQKIIVRRSAGG